VAHTQGRMTHRVRLFIDELTLTADDATLACVSIGRPVFMLGQLMPMLCVGGSITLLERQDAESFWRAHAISRPTYLLMPPDLTHEEFYVDVCHCAAGTVWGQHGCDQCVCGTRH